MININQLISDKIYTILSELNRTRISVSQAHEKIIFLPTIDIPKFIEYNTDINIPSGLYKILTNNYRIIYAEMFANIWYEFDTKILEDEKVIGLFTNKIE